MTTKTQTPIEHPYIPTHLWERDLPNNRTDLTLSLPHMELTVSVRSAYPPRTRRILARAILDALKPHLSGVRKATILHRPCSPDAWLRDFNRNLLYLRNKTPAFDHGRSHIGMRIRTKRINLGLKQEDLARQCKLSRTQLSRIETGRNAPAPLTLYRINEVLGRF